MEGNNMYEQILNAALSKIMQLITHMENFGYFYAGLAMVLEGASIPFPGMYVLIFCGFAIRRLNLNFWTLVTICSLCYTVASLVPYYIGGKVNNWAAGFFSKYYAKKGNQLKKVGELFNKYGEWTVCLSRPTFLGNYFSYIAGMNNMDIYKFLLYTFLGIFPWTLFMCYLGYSVISSGEQILEIIIRIKPVLYGISAVFLIYAAYKIYKFMTKNK